MKDNKIKYLIIVLIVMAMLLIGYFVINNVFHHEIIFEFHDTQIELKVGENKSISYQLNDNGDIIWESDNQNVVSINDGVMTGLSLGSVKITGTVIRGNETITRSIDVTTYIGEKDITLNEIIIPEGELYITKGKSYQMPIKYNPENSYIKKIEYNIGDSNIVSYDGNIVANNIGKTEITININDNINKVIPVHVVEKEIETTFLPQIKEVKVEDSITLKPKETKKIEYKINPENAFIENIKWESNNEKVVTVDNGMLTAISSGEAIVKLTVNNIVKEIKVIVTIPVTGLSLNSNPKLVLKVGEKETIKTVITPSNATNKKLLYINSNPNAVSVDNNGVITGIGSGTGTITIKCEDASYQAKITYTIHPKTGVVNNAGDIWGYTTPLEKVPVKASDTTLFKELATKGQGTLGNGVYIYNDGKTTYKYDIAKSQLSSNGKSVLTRIYYPEGVDLSTVNTFTFGNGTGSGAKGFSGILNELDKDRSLMKTSGIIILIASKTGSGYDRNEFILATDFVKSIVKQKAGVKNAVGGYSGSGREAGYAGNIGSYDRVVIFNSYIKAAYTTNLKNKEIIVYSPRNDKLADLTKEALNNMVNNGYSNVTVISNNTSIINGSSGNKPYKSYFLMINPGNQMGSGHGYVNIPPTKVFSYACR